MRVVANLLQKIITFTPALLLLCFCNRTPQTVTDIDGNIYHTVTIGTQVWMVENLKTTHYRNGDPIETTNPVTLDIDKQDSPQYQWAFAGNDSITAVNGRLYTWYTVTDPRGIAPTGWHVPTGAEFKILGRFFGTDSITIEPSLYAGTMYWPVPNDSTEYRYFALSAGSRWPNGEFLQMKEMGHFWGANEEYPGWAYRMANCFDGKSAIHIGSAKPSIGWPVRCIND